MDVTPMGPVSRPTNGPEMDHNEADSWSRDSLSARSLEVAIIRLYEQNEKRKQIEPVLCGFMCNKIK